MGNRLARLSLRPGLAAAALAASAAAWAQAPASPLSLPSLPPLDSTAVPPTVLALAPDDASRMTVPVMIDGRGPFAFVVDTGADRTVISQELAAQLGLAPGRPILMHATSGVALEQTAVVETLGVGQLHVHGVEAGLLTRANLGADGMLGVDALRRQDMVMDFKVKRFAVRLSDPDRDAADTIVVHGRNLYGELVLVDARIGGTPIYVVLDSGAQSTVANSALRRMLATRAPEKILAHVEIVSVTGGATPADVALLPDVEVGGVLLRNLEVGFADLHTFARLHLDDRPAMLLGMDALEHFDRVAVDFRRKQVSFRIHEGA